MQLPEATGKAAYDFCKRLIEATLPVRYTHTHLPGSDLALVRPSRKRPNVTMSLSDRNSGRRGVQAEHGVFRGPGRGRMACAAGRDEAHPAGVARAVGREARGHQHDRGRVRDGVPSGMCMPTMDDHGQR